MMHDCIEILVNSKTELWIQSAVTVHHHSRRSLSTRDVLCDTWHILNQTSVQCLLHTGITQTTVTKIDKASPRKASSPGVQTLTPRGIPSRQEANLSCPGPRLYCEMVRGRFWILLKPRNPSWRSSQGSSGLVSAPCSKVMKCESWCGV